MRIATALLILSMSLWPAPAQAYEKFIPLGHSYSPDQETLPPLNSDLDRLNAKVDIFESDIYTRERASKVFQSNLNQFLNGGNLRPNNSFIDY